MSTQNVMVGYLHGPTVTQEFHHCLFKLYIHDTFAPSRGGTQHIRDIVAKVGGVNVCRLRNELVVNFLDNENCEWLWMLDQDATFPNTMLDALLQVADPVERPIIGALAHQYRGVTDPDTFEPVWGPTGLQRRELLPTMYQTVWGDDGEWVGYREITSYEPGTLVPVDATGCHCLLVHRTVFEAIQSDHPYRWFREDEISPGVIGGEDIWFCMEATKAGFPIFVATHLESGHVKPVVLTHEMSHVERV